MIAVIDTGYFIERQIPTDKVIRGYVTDSVINELKTAESEEYLKFFSFMIEVRNPSEEYVEKVRRDLRKEVNNLSNTDIEVVALTLELKDEVSEMWVGPESQNQEEVVCFTNDNGIKNALLRYTIYESSMFSSRKYKVRCYGCFSLFSENLDFCKKCGHRTLTRIAVGDTENGEVMFFKKGYEYRKPKTLKNAKGVELRSADQREYVQYQKNLKSKSNRSQRGLDF
ncbi:putative nucleic acid-binding protein [Encephalitozoon intestinalis ATCC 50506]|uniref:Nucleic acid-binding protein n=1 Tax=Encephalitozoon intestinalis (strain ATCC 50506) TaxID=876142 RepID=E0S9A2_ENCIT|nr:putative nucleic acid-binding protein [Encephalitozoon intestinalis ATCC 50506]ADM12166.1 putative nucleic acid-binding protein [Encephalitozoon intestinalis ATCC 50506]UTX45968.1 putative RNA-binding protein NOB1 [Encephalitozoon intestinalis]